MGLDQEQRDRRGDREGAQEDGRAEITAHAARNRYNPAMGLARTVLSIAVVLSTTPAYANVELDVLGGGHVFSKTNPYGVDGVATETEKEAPLVGARLGIYVGSVFGIEGEGALIQTKTIDEPATA